MNKYLQVKIDLLKAFGGLILIIPYTLCMIFIPRPVENLPFYAEMCVLFVLFMSVFLLAAGLFVFAFYIKKDYVDEEDY